MNSAETQKEADNELLQEVIASALAEGNGVFTYENMWDLGTNGAEPFGVAFVYLAIDIIAISIKNGIIAWYKHIKYKKNLKLQQSLLDEDDVKLYGADETMSNTLDNFTSDENNDDENNSKENMLEDK